MKNSKHFLVYSVLFILSASLFSCEKSATTTAPNANLNGNPSAASAIGRGLMPYINAFQPNPVVAGDSTQVFVQLSKNAPAGGVVVTINKIRSAGPVADLPETLFIPAGQDRGSAFIHTLPFKDSIFEAIYATLPNFRSSEPALLLIVPRPKNDSRPPLQVYEAEKAFLKNATAKKADATSQGVFSNDAFAEYQKANRSYVRFDVTPAKPGEYILEFRYAWRTSTNQQPQQLTVQVNGVRYPLLFSPTASNNSNNLVYIRATLKQGNNSIYLGADMNGAGLRLDNLTVAAP